MYIVLYNFHWIFTWNFSTFPMILGEGYHLSRKKPKFREVKWLTQDLKTYIYSFMHAWFLLHSTAI